MHDGDDDGVVVVVGGVVGVGNDGVDYSLIVKWRCVFGMLSVAGDNGVALLDCCRGGGGGGGGGGGWVMWIALSMALYMVLVRCVSMLLL